MIGPVEAFADFDALPMACPELFAHASRDSFFATAAWWRSMLAAGMPQAAAAQFLLCRDGDRPVALLPLQTLNFGRDLQSLTNPYSCLYQPLLAPGLDDAALRAIGRSMAVFCRRWPVLRLDALPEELPARDLLLAGMRSEGLLVRRFAHFGNWHEPVAGRSFAEYLQTRPGELRETIRRRMRRAEREGVALEIVANPANLADGIAAYESVYARSWKVPEPYPDFNAQMMRHAAELGVLRLGVLRARAELGGSGIAIAVQLWIVMNGQACVLKLAHDEAFKSLSPGTLLTAMMIHEMLEREQVQELDFGRGDDDYKQAWTSTRRQRIGLLLINPRRPRGLTMLARQMLGATRQWARRRLS